MMVYPGPMAYGISIQDFDNLTWPRVNAILKSLSSNVPSDKLKPKHTGVALSQADWQKWAEKEWKKRGIKKPDGS